MPLTKDTILAAARDVVHRHGPSKATVVDVAQALGVSHGSIYRFFPTKAALREAVVGAWLDQITDALEAMSFEGPGPARLRAWFDAYLAAKVAQRAESPELFEAFRALSAEEPGTIAAYKQRLADQVAAILSRGMADGEFSALDPADTARALLNATVRFHHPTFARDWGSPQVAADFDTLWPLLIRGISLSRNTL